SAATQRCCVRSLNERAAAQRNHTWTRRLLQHRAQGVSFDFAKTGLAAQFKYFADQQLLSQLNFIIEVKERPAEKICQRAANRGLASAHETRERNQLRATSKLAVLIVCAHDSGGSIRAVITRRA